MAEAGGEANGLIPLVGDVVRECEICRAFDLATAIPVSGASMASSFNEKVLADLLVLSDPTVAHVLDLFSRYPPLVPVRPTNLGDVWDTSCASWIAVFGEPRIMQMGEGGEWKNDLRIDFRADRYFKSQREGAGSQWTCSSYLQPNDCRWAARGPPTNY